MWRAGRKRKYPVNFVIPQVPSTSDEEEDVELNEAREQRDGPQQQEVGLQAVDENCDNQIGSPDHHDTHEDHGDNINVANDDDVLEEDHPHVLQNSQRGGEVPVRNGPIPAHDHQDANDPRPIRDDSDDPGPIDDDSGPIHDDPGPSDDDPVPIHDDQGHVPGVDEEMVHDSDREEDVDNSDEDHNLSQGKIRVK